MKFTNTIIAFLLLCGICSTVVYGNSSSWRVQIVLVSESGDDNATWFGVEPDASVALDDFDFRKPILPIPVPQVYFYRPEWDADYSAFGADVRPAFNDSASWAFTVKATPGLSFQLIFSGLDSVDSRFGVWLFDAHNRMVQDLRAKPRVDLTAIHDMHSFRILVSMHYNPDVLKYAVPSQSRLRPSYPNPFCRATTIPIQIANETWVSVNIYNIAGRNIRQLANGWFTPGYYQFQWNGNDEAGRPVASGIYVVQLMFPNGLRMYRNVLLLK